MSSSEPQWIEITIKYPNKCKECNEDIIVGDRELWKKGEGVKHVKCFQQKDETPYSNRETESQEKHLYDKKIYSFKEVRKLNYCQFCGKLLSGGGDTYINCERKSCSKCFMV